MLMAPYFIALTLLSSFGEGSSLDSALVFIVIGITSLVFANIARNNGFEPFKWYSGKLDPHERKYLGIGIIALLAVVFGTTMVYPGPEGILVALLLGGFVLAFMLFKTETIIVPWFIHAAYNLTVLALAGGFFSFAGFSAVPLSASPIYVPSFALDPASVQSFFMSGVMQFFFVAFAEEMMKVSLALGVGMILNKNPKVMLGISVFLWVILHSILSYRVG